jgi:hypothetical protein
MRTGGIVGLMLLALLLTAGCIQLPGWHLISDTPDPITGQWITGEPPASELHMIFYENRSFYSISFFINRGAEAERGNWTKIGPGQYSSQPADGGITNWTYDSSDDTVYASGLPQVKYHRYKG